MLERPFEMVNKEELVYPSLLELATFSSNIYGPLSAPIGWEILNSIDSPSSGFRAACYGRNLLAQNAQVVFVYRGTVLSFPSVINDLLNDIEIAFGQIPSLSSHSIDFLVNTFNGPILNRYQGNTNALQYLSAVCTGHSLGAILADLTACFCNKDSGNITSITFENPGSLPMVKDMISDKPPSEQQKILDKLNGLFKSYQAGINLINTCKQQTGASFRIDKLDYHYKLNALGVMEFPPNPSYLSDAIYATSYTPNEHRIDNIVKFIEKDSPFSEIPKYLWGFQDGYVQYVNPANTDYWDGFFDAIWQSDTAAAKLIKSQYADFNAYKDHGYKQLIAVYETISKKKLYSPVFNLFNVEKEIKDFTLVERAKDEKPNTRCVIM